MSSAPVTNLYICVCVCVYLPMNRDVVFCMVVDSYKELISFSNINSRPWEPPIHCNNRLGMAQPAHILHFYLRTKKEEKNKKTNLFFCEHTKDHEWKKDKNASRLMALNLH